MASSPRCAHSSTSDRSSPATASTSIKASADRFGRHRRSARHARCSRRCAWCPSLAVSSRRVTDQATGRERRAERAAADLSEELEGLVDAGVRAGPERVDALRQVAAIARAGRPAFEEIDLGTDDALIGQLAERATALEEATRRRSTGSTRRRGQRRACQLLRGSGDYLLLAANNAQMQNGQGMFLSAGVLHVEDGRMRPRVDAAHLRHPRRRPRRWRSTPTSPARWGWLDPNDDFRHLGLSHRFPVTAETAVDLWVAGRSVAGRRRDGGRSLPAGGDPRGQRSGADPLQGGRRQGDRAGSRSTTSTRGTSTNRAGQAYYGRRDQLGDVAKAAVSNLEDVESRRADVPRAPGAAPPAGVTCWGGRADPAIQAGWVAAGIDGQISPDVRTAVVRQPVRQQARLVRSHRRPS